MSLDAKGKCPETVRPARFIALGAHLTTALSRGPSVTRTCSSVVPVTPGHPAGEAVPVLRGGVSLTGAYLRPRTKLCPQLGPCIRWLTHGQLTVHRRSVSSHSELPQGHNQASMGSTCDLGTAPEQDNCHSVWPTHRFWKWRRGAGCKAGLQGEALLQSPRPCLPGQVSHTGACAKVPHAQGTQSHSVFRYRALRAILPHIQDTQSPPLPHTPQAQGSQSHPPSVQGWVYCPGLGEGMPLAQATLPWQETPVPGLPGLPAVVAAS